MVRGKLDRKHEVSALMDTFNRDLMVSRRELESYVSPCRRPENRMTAMQDMKSVETMRQSGRISPSNMAVKEEGMT